MYSPAIYMFPSLIFCVIGIFLFFYLKNKKKYKIKTCIAFFIALTTLALIPLYLLKYNIQHSDTMIGGFLLSILDALHATTGKAVYGEVIKVSGEKLGDWQEVIFVYASLLHMAIFIAVASFIFAIFKEFTMHVKYRLIENGKLCVFCNVSNQTLTLAEDIRNKDGVSGIKNTIVFINTRREDIEVEFLEKIDKIGAYIFRTALHDFVLKRCFLRQEINIFVFENDDIKNIHTMLSFIKKSDEKNSLHKVNYKLNTVQNSVSTNKEQRETGICIHILSSCHETETILDSIEANELSYNMKYSRYDYFCDASSMAIHTVKNWLQPYSANMEKKYCTESQSKENSITQPIKNLTIGKLVKKPIYLRLVRENRSTFYNLFNTKPLFLGINDESLTVLVVGGGINGREAVKIASWCGQSLAKKLEIILIDSDKVAKHRLERDCPEMFIVDGDEDSAILENKLTPEQKLSKEECTVFFYERHVEDAAFIDVLKKHANIGYTICTLGDDQLNLRIAMNIRSLFEQNMTEGYKNRPFIAALLNDSFLVETGNKLKFDTKLSCWIHTFGGQKEIYAWDNIIAPYFSELGRLVNEFYYTYKVKNSDLDKKTKNEKINNKLKDANDAYEQKEYNRTSSIATGIHTKYKIYAILCQHMKEEFFTETWNGYLPEHILLKAQKHLNTNTNGIIEELAKLEHKRWDTYMRSNGWQGAHIDIVKQYKSLIGDYRNFASRLQPCIRRWEDLPALSDELNENFQETDRALVRKTVITIEQAMHAVAITAQKTPLLPAVGITGRRELALAASEQGEDPSPACKPLLINLLRAIRALHYDIIIKNPQFFTVQPELRLCSCLASGKGSLYGADRFVAAEALKLNYMLDVALPFAPTSSIHTRDADDKDKSQVELNQLLYKARDVLIFGDDEAIERIASGDTDEAQKERDKIYQQASRAMLDHCNVLIALWDDKKTENDGGTWENIKIALNENKLVFLIDSASTSPNIRIMTKDGEDSVENIKTAWDEYIAKLPKVKAC